MRRILCLLALFGIAAAIHVPAQTKKAVPGTKQLKGYVMDRMCGSKLPQRSPEQAEHKAAKHTRICALMDGCAASGYGLVLNGIWTPFDEKGSNTAEEFLRKSTAEDHLLVTVTGTMKGGMIVLASIKEAKE